MGFDSGTERTLPMIITPDRVANSIRMQRSQWDNILDTYGLNFNDLNFKKIIDIKSFTAAAFEELITIVKNNTISKSSAEEKKDKYKIDAKFIKNETEKLMVFNCDLWHICCGHDLTCILSIGLRRFIGNYQQIAKQPRTRSQTPVWERACPQSSALCARDTNFLYQKIRMFYVLQIRKAGALRTSAFPSGSLGTSTFRSTDYDSKQADPEIIERSLRLAYESNYFEKTNLYNSIRKWEKTNIPFKVLIHQNPDGSEQRTA
jgi:hypothetical protein